MLGRLVGGSKTRLGVLGVVMVSCAGCSFGLRPPPSDPEQRQALARKGCGDRILYPAADTLSVAAGATWVIVGNDRIQSARARGESTSSRGNAERIFGYSAMGVFGAGAIYGFIVSAQCYGVTRALARARANQPATSQPTRRQFPESVAQFRFGASPSDAERACITAGNRWQPEDSFAICRASAPSPVHPDFRLEFRIAKLEQISVVYGAAPAALHRTFDQVYGSTRGFFGTPQVERAPWSADCEASLAQCLADGEHPSAPTWHWSTGSIELTPTLRGEEALIELRYSRQAAAEQ